VLRVAIIGGGLAGIAAAVRLAGTGAQPIVIETRRKLGGRATSFIDPRTDEVLDNCQHVLMGCCTNLIDLYDKLGVLEKIEWHKKFYWTAGRGVIDEMKPSLLPAPFHLTPSFNRLSWLSKQDRKAIARAMWRLIRCGFDERQRWQDRTFAEFLRQCDQPESAMQRFWNVIIVSACNLDVERIAAPLAMQVFQEGFLANKWSCAMGLPAVPLWELYESAEEIITAAGGELRLGESAKSIAFDGMRVNGVVTDEVLIEASAVVAAVPPDRLDKLVSEALRQADQRLQHLGKYTFSSILGVHLFFAKEVMTLPHLTLVDHDTQWLFNKGVSDDGGQHIHAVISAADKWMSLSEEDIADRIVRDLHSALPASRGLQPVAVRAVREKRATVALTPEAQALRPSTSPHMIGLSGGGVRNLFLAGDWTDTGWPATMEGAARSGYAAAAAILDDDSLGPVADIPAGALARIIGLR
jgi:squalene-associated FAD-dependent desaturase